MTDSGALIQKILDGDTDAFRELITANQRLVFHVVFRLVENPADREDLCQDIFVKVYQNLQRFKHNCKLSTWIATIAYNTAINSLKKKRLPLYDDRLPANQTVDSLLHSQCTQEHSLIQQDLLQQLENEIRKLPERYATIISLFHLEEMTYAEIGKVMNLPEGTVKSHLFRARKLLKERLLKKYPEEELWKENA